MKLKVGEYYVSKMNTRPVFCKIIDIDYFNCEVTLRYCECSSHGYPWDIEAFEGCWKPAPYYNSPLWKVIEG